MKLSKATTLIVALMLLAPGLVFSTATTAGSFDDVPGGAYYAEAVTWATESGVTNGTSENCFSPGTPATRGQTAALLFRMAGSPSPGSSHPFVDVTASYQQDPISWLYNQRVTFGRTASLFDPEAWITRGEFAALLHRFAGSPPAGPLPFADVRASYQVAPVAWMAERGITVGTSPTTFGPNRPITRAEIVTMLWRYSNPGSVNLSLLANERPVIFADESTVLDQPNTIYDFQFQTPGEVVIRASNVEARNIRGPGARRIGVTGGTSITDSGFRNFEFTFAHVQLSKGATVTRPYFIDGWDVNPQPHVADGDIVQFFAYQGDIIEPLIQNVTIYGKKLPEGSDAHNDALQFEGIQGGIIWSPTIRDNRIEGASNAAIQIGSTGGTVTIEGNTMSQRWESYYAVNAGDNCPSPVILWRNNTMLNGAQHIFRSGYSLHPESERIPIGTGGGQPQPPAANCGG